MTAYARLDNTYFPIDPDSVSWDYQVKLNVEPTIGGRVVQVLGVHLGDMMVSGTFGKGGAEGRQRQRDFFLGIRGFVDTQVHSQGRVPKRFVYPPRKWDFHVLIKALTTADGAGSVTDNNNLITPHYTLTLFVVQDNVGNVSKIAKDAYITRLAAGVGWKQTGYNGPSQATVDAQLAAHGGSYSSWLESQFESAAQGNAPVRGGG